MIATQSGRGRIIIKEASIMSIKNAKSLTLNRRKTMKGGQLKVKREGNIPPLGRCGVRAGTSKRVEIH